MEIPSLQDGQGIHEEECEEEHHYEVEEDNPAPAMLRLAPSEKNLFVPIERDSHEEEEPCSDYLQEGNSGLIRYADCHPSFPHSILSCRKHPYKNPAEMPGYAESKSLEMRGISIFTIFVTIF